MKLIFFQNKQKREKREENNDNTTKTHINTRDTRENDDIFWMNVEVRSIDQCMQNGARIIIDCTSLYNGYNQVHQ